MTSPTPSSRDESPKRRRRRHNTVYDVVAGMHYHSLLIGNASDFTTGYVDDHRRLRNPESENKTDQGRWDGAPGVYSFHHARLAPEDVLFSRKNAPMRYEEDDFYWANERLRDGGRHDLPDSELLKTMHGYASKFYEAMAQRLGAKCFVGKRTIDERSMDETALLAFGILLEEASREALGSRGDLVFTEGSTEGQPSTRSKSRPDGHTRSSSTLGAMRSPKRRKVTSVAGQALPAGLGA